jgi:hypothetical protein
MPHVILDDLPVINGKDMQTRGLAEFTLRLAGLVGRPEATATLKINNAELEIFGGLSVRKVNGSIVYEKNKLVSSGIDLFLNQLPFRVDFSVDTASRRPHVLLNLNSVAEGRIPPDFVVHVDADWTEARRLKGEASGSWRNMSKDLTHCTAFSFKGLEAAIERDLSLSCDDLQISFDVTSGKDGSVKDVFHRTFILENISVAGRKEKGGFALEPFKPPVTEGCWKVVFLFIRRRGHSAPTPKDTSAASTLRPLPGRRRRKRRSFSAASTAT